MTRPELMNLPLQGLSIYAYHDKARLCELVCPDLLPLGGHGGHHNHPLPLHDSQALQFPDFFISQTVNDAIITFKNRYLDRVIRIGVTTD